MIHEAIRCHGSMFDIGRQYGEARSHALAKALEDFFGLFAWFPQQASREGLVKAARHLLKSAEAFDPSAVDFARGQAQGAQVDFEEVFCLHCSLELMFNYANLSSMCTSFAVTGSATLGGKTIVGQNVDWFTCTPIDLLRIHYSGGGEALALCFFGVPYYFMNSAKICNCANLTVGPGMPGPQTPLCIYLSKAMREPDLNSAMGVIRSAANGLGYFHLADSAGTVLGIESIPGAQALLSPKKGVLAHANHYEHTEFQPLDLGLSFMPDSPLRSQRMRQLIAARHGRIDVQEMFEILRDHEGHPSSICRHVDPNVPPALASESRASVVMVPKQGVLWLTIGPPCESEYQEYRLA